MVHKAIIAQLLADANLTGFVGTRIYHLEAPPDVTMPYIVTDIDNDWSDHDAVGANGLAQANVNVYCYATANARMSQVYERVRIVLDGQQFTAGGVNVLDVTRQASWQEIIPPSAGERRGIRQAIQAFEVWYEEITS